MFNAQCQARRRGESSIEHGAFSIDAQAVPCSGLLRGCASGSWSPAERSTRSTTSSPAACFFSRRTFPRCCAAAALADAHLANKTIVLTGAMVPYAFGSSDGLFNLGSALSFVQVLPAGVYIAMNGQHFLWDQCRKNRETGVFES